MNENTAIYPDHSSDPLLCMAQQRFNVTFLFPYQRLVISNILESFEAATSNGTALPGGEPIGAPDPLLPGGEPIGAPDPVLPVEEQCYSYSPGPPPGVEPVPDATPHQIVILPTGAGKSLCFMLPALFLPGPTLVIFPLLGLIADQARRCKEAGIGSGVLKGGQAAAEREAVWKGITNGKIKILLSNPETVLQPAVLKQLRAAKVSHLVIDEMHTVSEWGDTFRPVYLEIGRLAQEASIPIVTAFTATASEHILDRIKTIIFSSFSPHIIAANPDRPNISYRVIPSISKNHDLVRLLSRRVLSSEPHSDTVPPPAADSCPATVPPPAAEGHPVEPHPNPDRIRQPSVAPVFSTVVERPAIVFVRSRVDAQMTARMLRHRLHEDQIYFYHAGLEPDEKKAVEEWFFHSDDGILCTTCAYGMGVDKKNVRTVIHFSPSPSVEAYLQESGRGGRDREAAEAILLYGPHEAEHLHRITDPLSKQRYQAMLDYAGNSGRCRREVLLEMLQAEPEACFGCDVCRETVEHHPSGRQEIIDFVHKNRRRYTMREVKQIVAGRKTLDVQTHVLWKNRFFGMLTGWSLPEIEEALKALIASGDIRIPKHGPWKHRLTS